MHLIVRKEVRYYCDKEKIQQLKEDTISKLKEENIFYAQILKRKSLEEFAKILKDRSHVTILFGPHSIEDHIFFAAENVISTWNNDNIDTYIED